MVCRKDKHQRGPKHCLRSADRTYTRQKPADHTRGTQHTPERQSFLYWFSFAHYATSACSVTLTLSDRKSVDTLAIQNTASITRARPNAHLYCYTVAAQLVCDPRLLSSRYLWRWRNQSTSLHIRCSMDDVVSTSAPSLDSQCHTNSTLERHVASYPPRHRSSLT